MLSHSKAQRLWESHWYKFLLKAKESGLASDVPRWWQEQKLHPFNMGSMDTCADLPLLLLFCSIMTPRPLNVSSYVQSVSFLLQFAVLPAAHLWKHPHKHTHKCVVTNFLGIFSSPVSLTKKTNHYNHYSIFVVIIFDLHAHCKEWISVHPKM